MKWNGVIDFASAASGPQTNTAGNLRNVVMHKGATFPTGISIPQLGQLFFYTGAPLGTSILSNTLCEYTGSDWQAIATGIGSSGYSGAGISGYSGTSGYSGINPGASGYSGISGYSGSGGGSGSGSIFGDWVTTGFVAGIAYLAATDGFLAVRPNDGAASADLHIYSDTSNPPTTVVFDGNWNFSGSDQRTYVMPIRKGDWWKVTAAYGIEWIHWLPGAGLGGGGAGPWTSGFTPGTTYQAATDGFVVSHQITGPHDLRIQIKTDSAASPTTIRWDATGYDNSAWVSGMCPVKAGDYWNCDTTDAGMRSYMTIYWISFASGSGSGERVSSTVTQTGHAFVVGNVLRHNGTSYIKAQANSAANAEVVGIVSTVTGTDIFILTDNGYITGLAGLTAGSVYFLSDSIAGALTATEPTTADYISKPLLIATSTTTGWFNNWRGLTVGPSGSGNGFGDWESKVRDTTYQATEDGFVVAVPSNGNLFALFVSSVQSNVDTHNTSYQTGYALQTQGTDDHCYASICCPVKRNEYWQVWRESGVGGGDIKWIPDYGGIGSVLTATIIAYAGSTAPVGYLLCDGSTVSRTTYANLYAIIGHTYGADPGGGNFIIPDLRGRITLGKDNMGGTDANRVTDVQGHTLGGTLGSETTSTASAANSWSPQAGPPSTIGTHSHTNLQPSLTINYIIKT